MDFSRRVVSTVIIKVVSRSVSKPESRIVRIPGRCCYCDFTKPASAPFRVTTFRQPLSPKVVCLFPLPRQPRPFRAAAASPISNLGHLAIWALWLSCHLDPLAICPYPNMSGVRAALSAAFRYFFLLELCIDLIVNQISSALTPTTLTPRPTALKLPPHSLAAPRTCGIIRACQRSYPEAREWPASPHS